MSKKLLSVLAALGLVVSGLIALPARAQEPAVPEVPAAPNIVDPVGDAHYGANGAPRDAGTVSDLVAVWFTHDATNLNVHIQTEGPGPALSSAYYFDVTAVPVDGANCAAFELLMPGPSYVGDPFGRFRDLCTEGAEQVPGEFVMQEAADGTGITTLTIPRADQAMLADGAVLGAPIARVRHATGPVPSQVPRDPILGIGGGTFITGPTPDNTAVGTDYVIAASTAEPPPDVPPTDPDDKPKKKGCKKNSDKGNKKGCKKGKGPGTPPPPPPPPPAGCAAYVPGEEGAEAETTIVTDAATADAPIEVEIVAPEGHANDQGVGVYDGTASAFHNIQVDTDNADAGLYLSYEFPIHEDHDVYLNYASGSEAAHVGGFNPAPVALPLFPLDGTGTGGHSEQGSENLDGVRTKDCAGYTATLTSFISQGGTMTLKLWLGESTYDPAPPGE